MKKNKIIFYPEQGISQAKILKILEVSRYTVQEAIKKKIETGDIKDRKKMGKAYKIK